MVPQYIVQLIRYICTMLQWLNELVVQTNVTENYTKNLSLPFEQIDQLVVEGMV